MTNRLEIALEQVGNVFIEMAKEIIDWLKAKITTHSVISYKGTFGYAVKQNNIEIQIYTSNATAVCVSIR